MNIQQNKWDYLQDFHGRLAHSESARWMRDTDSGGVVDVVVQRVTAPPVTVLLGLLTLMMGKR